MSNLIIRPIATHCSGFVVPMHVTQRLLCAALLLAGAGGAGALLARTTPVPAPRAGMVPRATTLRLRGGEEHSAARSGGAAAASQAADGGRQGKAPPKIDSGEAKEMLYQLTTQLFNPARAGSKVDYYELLEISRSASPKEIRDGYYRAAKKWHPDKNKQDPNAEARFKTISEAYEVLSDPEKRKIYDQHGAEGLEAAAAMDKIDVKSLVRALFGGGEFDDIFGDVSELPSVRSFVKQVAAPEKKLVLMDGLCLHVAPICPVLTFATERWYG